MRALVLGGTGMLGQAVAAEWRRRDVAVLALSSSQADLTDRQRLLYWADTFRPQLIVNCAAFTQVDACEEQREHALEINGRAVENAVAAAELHDAALVQVSSDYVFAGGGSEPYPEDADTGPLSVYGESKLLGEQSALRYRRALVLRSSWLFGPGGPNFVLTMRRLMLAGTPLRVVDDQTGCPTYTPYLARAIWDLAQRGSHGVMHYRNRQAVSWHGFAVAISSHVRPGHEISPVPTEEFPRPACRPPYSVLGVERFEAAVGRPAESWEAGLVAYLDDSRGIA